MGSKLYDEFQPGMTSLDGVPLPYRGLGRTDDRLRAVGRAGASAVSAGPATTSRSEQNHGESQYHSLQMKLERRFSQGFYALVSYTLSRTVSNGSDNTQTRRDDMERAHGVISPFEQNRTKAVTVDDVPHVLSAAFVYELPVGQGKKYLNEGGVTQALLGGWQLSTIFRYSSGTPVLLPSQRTPATCRASSAPGASRRSPIRTPCSRRTRAASIRQRVRSSTRSRSSRCRAFNFYFGQGNRIEESVRGFGYHNQDLSFIKNTRMGGGTNLQFRFEMFNMWNWHIFGARGTTFNDTTAGFDLDLASPTFGQWKGAVSTPRNMQLAVRFEF